ncbi:hypothetical protein MLD38_019984 [Melastoma candidum]|uniref:Uncharacterized protein n=1 Tax=Melastoma candidum TaxID=119954 RepID=A0ACB9QCH1_9MYRT|nr:hypothetical protein MLD38_019984 [Melastoma candidum]
MAMLGNHKGMHLQYRGKPFGLVVLLALSAAVFGVMAVNKLREKQALSVLLREKDRELYELQVLLQKEKDQAREINVKAKEIKDMVYTLSSQKRDQDARIMEMESTISSMKDEHQALVMTLEDRANEIKMLREKEMDLSKKESEETNLREIIRLKEAEIEDLTRRLGSTTQAKNAQQENVVSPNEKEKGENARGGNQENNINGSQDQQQAVTREEVIGTGDQVQITEPVNGGESSGVDTGISKGEIKVEGMEESSEISAPAVRHGGAQMSRKRLKRLRAIARNRRMGKRRSRSIIRNTGEDQTQRDNGGEQPAPEAEAATNHSFGSPGFDSGDESGTIQDSVSKVEILPEESAEENENHQDTQMVMDVASSVDEVKEATGENRNSEGDDSGKQPNYSDDAGSNNSQDRVDNAGGENINDEGDDSGKQPKYSDDVESNNSEDQVDNAGAENRNGEADDSGKQPKYSNDAGSNDSEDQVNNAGAENRNGEADDSGNDAGSNNSEDQTDNAGGENRNGEGDDPGKQPQYSDDAGSNNSENHVVAAGSSEPAIDDGSSPALTQMENTNPIENTETIPQEEPEDATQYEANNHSKGTTEETQEDKIDEPEF